jgi:hypothetical protein
MGQTSLRHIVIGFIAGAIAVVTAHQLMLVALTAAGLIKAQAWSMAGVPPFGVPVIVNGMFWGGLWGALFAVIWTKLPGGAMWLKGLIYGLCVVVISNWLLLPLIKGKIFGQANQLLFAGGDPKRLLAGALILGAFGLATGLLYGLIAKPRDA